MRSMKSGVWQSCNLGRQASTRKERFCSSVQLDGDVSAGTLSAGARTSQSHCTLFWQLRYKEALIEGDSRSGTPEHPVSLNRIQPGAFTSSYQPSFRSHAMRSMKSGVWQSCNLTAASQSSTCEGNTRRLQDAKHDLKLGLTRGSKRDVGCWLHSLMLQLRGLLTFFADDIPTSPLLCGALLKPCTKCSSTLQRSQMHLQPRSAVCRIWGSKRPHTKTAFAQGWNLMGAH